MTKMFIDTQVESFIMRRLDHSPAMYMPFLYVLSVADVRFGISEALVWAEGISVPLEAVTRDVIDFTAAGFFVESIGGAAQGSSRFGTIVGCVGGVSPPS
jgi:hypothetical protein